MRQVLEHSPSEHLLPCEHQPPSHDDGAPSCLAVSDRGCATVLSSLSFVLPGLQPQASNGAISHLTLDYNKDDHTGTDQSLVCAIYLTTVLLNSSVSFQPNPRISCIPPEDLEWTAGVSPRGYRRKDQIAEATKEDWEPVMTALSEMQW